MVGLVQYATICPKTSSKELLCAVVLSRLGYCNSLLAGCPKYLLSELQKVQNIAARLIFRTSRSARVTPMRHSLHWLPVEQRIEYKLSLLCFKIILIRLPSTFQNFFTFTLLPGSSALLQTPECSEYHPSERKKVLWSALFLLPDSSYLEPTPCICHHSTSVSSFKSSLKTSLLKGLFFSPIALNVCVCVCVWGGCSY